MFMSPPLSFSPSLFLFPVCGAHAPVRVLPLPLPLAQLISWDGRTGVGEDAAVDIILRSKAIPADFRVVVATNARTSTDGVSRLFVCYLYLYLCLYLYGLAKGSEMPAACGSGWCDMCPRAMVGK